MSNALSKSFFLVMLTLTSQAQQQQKAAILFFYHESVYENTNSITIDLFVEYC